MVEGVDPEPGVPWGRGVAAEASVREPASRETFGSRNVAASREGDTSRGVLLVLGAGLLGRGAFCRGVAVELGAPA